jgi:hypothetical protein
MFPVLRSLDNLLNRFDELSQRHASFISDFDRNFTNIKNPLHDISRDENERRKTTENLSRIPMEIDDQLGSGRAVEHFNRRVIKNRRPNRPPSYSSNDGSPSLRRIPSRSSLGTTESAPSAGTSVAAVVQSTIRTSNSQPRRSISVENLIEPKTRVTIKIKPKVLQQNPSTTKRNARSAITTFTIETINRLSRPRSYCHSLERKISSKRVHRRPRPSQSIKKVAPESSIPLSPLPAPPPLPQSASSHIKRANPTTIKSSPKKHKAENKFVTDDSKRIPMSNYPRPAVFVAPPPTICLTFPMQPELKSSRVVVIPKANTTTHMSAKKTINIFTNKQSLIPPNRTMYLMA